MTRSTFIFNVKTVKKRTEGGAIAKILTHLRIYPQLHAFNQDGK